MNRNFNNQSIVTDDTLLLIQQNNTSILQKANIFTAKQTFDEIVMNKITLTPVGNSVSIGSLYSVPTNSTSIGIASIEKIEGCNVIDVGRSSFANKGCNGSNSKIHKLHVCICKIT